MMEGCLKGFFIVLFMCGVQWVLFRKVIGWPAEKAGGIAVAVSLAVGFFYRLYNYYGFGSYLMDIITAAAILYGYLVTVRSFRSTQEKELEK